MTIRPCERSRNETFATVEFSFPRSCVGMLLRSNAGALERGENTSLNSQSGQVQKQKKPRQKIGALVLYGLLHQNLSYEIFPYFIRKAKVAPNCFGAKFPYFIKIIFLVEVYFAASILQKQTPLDTFKPLLSFPSQTILQKLALRYSFTRVLIF